MTDSASLGRATLTVDIDQETFENELRRVREQIEQFAPSFGGVDQVIKNVAQQLRVIEQSLQRINASTSSGASSGIVGSAQDFSQATRSVQAYTASLRALDQQVRQSAGNGLGIDRIGVGPSRFGQGPLRSQQRRRTNEENAAAAVEAGRQELERQREARRQQELASAALRSSPISGRLPGGRLIPGSPAARADRRARITQATGDAIIGGFFPLLFGQGPVAAAGGALGGAAGGAIGGPFGFGLSIAGTAVGQGLNTNLQNGVAISQALRDPINQFQALKDAAALSSKGLERNVEALIAQGRTAEAAAAIQRDIRENFGSAEEFRRFEQQQDTLGRTFGRLGVVTSSVAADPLTGLLSGLSRSVEDFSLLIGRPVPGSNRTEEDVRTDRLRSFGLFGFGRTDSGRETRQANALREEIRRAEQEARQREFTRLQRTQGAITFNELRGNRLGALQNELSAFDQNRANRLAAAPPEQRQSVANQLVQERYRLEQQISAEIRNQAALNEQSANKVLDLRRQTATLKQAPFITDRDLRLLESQDALSAARDTATAARNAAQANPENPDLQRAARETGAALEQAAQRYDNQRIATEREAARLALESSNRLGSLADRLKAAKTLPFISPRDQQVFEAALQARDAARRRNEAQAEAKQAPGNRDLQRAAAAAAKEAEVSGQNYRNSIRLAAEDLVRTQLASRNLIASLRERGSIAAASPGLTGAGVSALRARAQFNDEVRSDREVILAARQRPADVDLQRKAVESGERLKAAGQEFRSSIVQAFETAKRESENLRRSARDIVFSLAKRQADEGPESLNNFLPFELQQIRLQRAFNQLLPQFEDAKRAVRSQFGQIPFAFNSQVELGGTPASLGRDIRTMISFINAARPEEDLTKDLAVVNQDLEKATNSLQVVMSQLNEVLPAALNNASAAISDLATKDWKVYVSVPGQPTFVPLPNTP